MRALLQPFFSTTLRETTNSLILFLLELQSYVHWLASGAPDNRLRIPLWSLFRHLALYLGLSLAPISIFTTITREATHLFHLINRRSTRCVADFQNVRQLGWTIRLTDLYLSDRSAHPILPTLRYSFATQSTRNPFAK